MAAKRVLIVGTGARKHALVRRLLDDGCDDVWIAPGNPALASLPVRQAPVGTGSLPALAAWADSQSIDLAVILDEALLFRGIADELLQAGIACLGPTRSAALIERSKVLAKNLMRRVGARTPPWRVYPDPHAAWEECSTLRFPAVIKADGPPRGNGVFIVDNVAEARQALRWIGEHEVGSAPVLVESFIGGPEFSLTVLAGARGDLVLLPLVHEYKRAATGDRSELTRGMGAFAPVRVDDRALLEVLGGVERVLGELRRDGMAYTGSLTTNVILGPDGPELLEFNSHVGDPETQTMLPVLDGSLLDIVDATANDALGGFIDLHRRVATSSVSLSLVRRGYPGPSRSEVLVPEELTGDGYLYFYETYRVDGGLAPSGGRVLSCHASADSFDEAVARARAVAVRVTQQVPGLTFRDDIGTDHDSMTRHARITSGGL